MNKQGKRMIKKLLSRKKRNKKEFHASKNFFALNLVDINKIVISDKFKHSGKGSKYFIGYKDHDIIRPLCIVLPQINGT